MVEANIVRDFYIGKTRIKIADNYCRKSAEDIENTLRRIAQKAQQHINAAASTGNYEVHTATKN